MPKKTAAPNVTGFRVRPRYRDVTCDWFDLEDGEEPLKATIRTNLTFAQLEEIPSGDHVTFPEVWEVIYPYVVAWNVLAEDESTGDIVPVPPPAEAGPEVAKLLDAQMSLWLITQVRMAHLGGAERKNGSAPSGGTSGPDGDKS